MVADATTPFTDSLQLGEQTHGKAEVWLVEGAGHLQALTHPEFLKRIKRFLRERRVGEDDDRAAQ